MFEYRILLVCRNVFYGNARGDIKYGKEKFLVECLVFIKL